MTEFGSTARLSWRRIGGVAGIVFGLGMGVGVTVLLGSAPDINDSIGDIRAYFTDDATTFLITSWFIAFFLVGAFLLFASALRSVLAGSDSDAGM